jgi:hypothetical protein
MAGGGERVGAASIIAVPLATICRTTPASSALLPRAIDRALLDLRRQIGVPRKIIVTVDFI